MWQEVLIITRLCTHSNDPLSQNYSNTTRLTFCHAVMLCLTMDCCTTKMFYNNRSNHSIQAYHTNSYFASWSPLINAILYITAEEISLYPQTITSCRLNTIAAEAVAVNRILYHTHRAPAAIILTKEEISLYPLTITHTQRWRTCQMSTQLLTALL